MSKPIYKRVWFWILAVIAALFALLFLATPSEAPAPKEYTEVTIEGLYEELNNNPLKAEENYKDAYISVTGRLSVIDSEYIAITTEEASLDAVQCYIMDDTQLEVIKGLSKGDIITVKGKIRRVSDSTGYSMYIKSIEG